MWIQFCLSVCMCSFVWYNRIGYSIEVVQYWSVIVTFKLANEFNFEMENPRFHSRQNCQANIRAHWTLHFIPIEFHTKIINIKANHRCNTTDTVKCEKILSALYNCVFSLFETGQNYIYRILCDCQNKRRKKKKNPNNGFWYGQ